MFWAVLLCGLLAVPCYAKDGVQRVPKRAKGVFDPAKAQILQHDSMLAFYWKDPANQRLDLFEILVTKNPCNGTQPSTSSDAATDRAAISHVYCTPHPIQFNGNRLIHWAHFMQALVPCWSLFERTPRAQRHLLVPKSARVSKCPFAKRLTLLGISVVHKPNARDCVVSLTGVSRYNTRDGTRGREGAVSFMQAQDAAAFRDRILNAFPPPASTVGAGALTVGILNRQFARQFLPATVARIRRWLATQCPACKVTELLDLSLLGFLEQVQWINTRDVIISPHGAQLVNVVFGSPCTILMEFYPRQWFFPGWYLPLARQLNMLPFGFYASNASPYKTTERCITTAACRVAAKGVAIDVPDEAFALFPRMLDARRECRARLPVPS